MKDARQITSPFPFRVHLGSSGIPRLYQMIPAFGNF